VNVSVFVKIVKSLQGLLQDGRDRDFVKAVGIGCLHDVKARTLKLSMQDLGQSVTWRHPFSQSPFNACMTVFNLEGAFTSGKIGCNNVELAVHDECSVDAQHIRVLAQGHNLGLTSELVNLVALKHVKVHDLDRHPPVQRLVVCVVYHGGRTIAYIRVDKQKKTCIVRLMVG